VTVVERGHLPLTGEPVAAETTAAARTQRWPRWALAVLLAATAVLYLWNLSASGYGNTFYAAAAQAGSQRWSAWFFGSLDAHNFITVDKPPASLWVTGLSVRLFGMNSWSVMAPQALMGVAAVAVLYCTVRRAFADPNHGAAAGLLAGAVLAGTPAAALMFRFNNPDALLVLLLTVAAYCLMRAASAASWRWLQLVGVAMGTAFLTKMMQGFLVLPGFGLAYLLVAPTSWPKRVLHLLGAVAALIAAAGWWVLTVQLTPASARPYIGGSTDNTVLDLALGYNGINRLLGHHREGRTLHDNAFGAGRRHSVFHRDGGDPASRDNAHRDPVVEGDRRLDRRRSHQRRTRRPARCDAHAVVGGDERFAVGGRPRNRFGHIGDGRRRLER